MSHDEILQAAKEAGCNDEFIKMAPCWLERFAAIIERKTIERCAVVCDESAHEWRGANSRQVELAAAIRKLGEQE